MSGFDRPFPALGTGRTAVREDEHVFDYESHFEQYRSDHELDILLSFDMPSGYETANGTFDAESKTVFINAERLKEAPDYEKAYCLFHELRHSSQYLSPGAFSHAVRRSSQYIIMYDGTCFKIIEGRYRTCMLEGGEEFFTDIYLGQPYEVDANTYAYEQARKICGDSDDLRKLYGSWLPRRPVPDEVYDSVYALIDERTGADPGS